MKRSDKKFPLDSMEFSRKMGGVILKGLGNKNVDVHNPDIEVKIENILNVLRALSLLANFDVLVPEQEIVPTIVIERRVKRQRVRHKKTNEDKIEIEWKWGDES